MSHGGYTSHLASRQAEDTSPPQAPADHLRVYASSADIVLAHRDKLTAGVPGCTCGESYPEDSHAYSAVLHARHVAQKVVSHVLDAAVAAIYADLENFACDPERWSAGSHDSLASITALNMMARLENGQSLKKETTTA